jgi:hypothetical protein
MVRTAASDLSHRDKSATSLSANRNRPIAERHSLDAVSRCVQTTALHRERHRLDSTRDGVQRESDPIHGCNDHMHPRKHAVAVNSRYVRRIIRMLSARDMSVFAYMRCELVALMLFVVYCAIALDLI